MKKKKIILMLMLFVAVLNADAQKIYIYFTNGSINEYPLSEVRKISFSEANMLLHKTDDEILSWAISNINKYDYNLITETPEIVESSPFDILIYPNPSKGSFKLDYQIDKLSEINISIVSIDGRLYETLVSEKKEKGSYTLNVNNYNLYSGTYFIKIQDKNKSTIKKIIILK